MSDEVFFSMELQDDLGSFRLVKVVCQKVLDVHQHVSKLSKPVAWDYFVRELALKQFGAHGSQLWTTDKLCDQRVVLWISSFDSPVHVLHAWKPGKGKNAELLALTRSLMRKVEARAKK